VNRFKPDTGEGGRRIPRALARTPALASLTAIVLAALPPGALAAGNGGFAPPAASPSAGAIREIYWVIFAICAVVFVLVESALVLFVLRFRRRGGTPADAEGPQVHGNTRLEVIWTIVPALILVGIATFTFVKTPAVRASNPGSAEGRPLVVQVQAHQFYWEYVYPTGAVTLDEIRLPVDRPVELRITTLDVAHSWWVPELDGKMDAIPGHTNVLSFVPDRTGTFDGRCAELCGIQHAFMRTYATVMPQQAFDSWLGRETARQQQGRSSLGHRTWQAVCAKCHGIDGQGDIGPSIQGNSTLVDAGALNVLLQKGQDTSTFPSYMPPVGRGWPQRQLTALVRYLKATKEITGARPAAAGGTSGSTG